MFPLEVRQHPAFLPVFLTPSDAQQVGSVFFFLEKEGGRSGKAGLLARETLLPGRFQESGGSDERGVEADPESGQIGGRRRSGRRRSGTVNRDKMTKADLLPQWREGGAGKA